MREDLVAFEEQTGAALRAVAGPLAALPAGAAAGAVLAALGVPDFFVSGRARPQVPRVALPEVEVPGAIEAWSFAAGQRRVAFVTVPPERVATTVAAFPGAHVETRARRVEIGPQDRWHDDRARGAPRVELFIARTASDARDAAAMQAEDPTRHGAALGALLGYPPCCVAAFLAQRTRHDNSLNRHLTDARTTAGGPWPWLLNDLHWRLVAFYPCRYDCPAAVAVARATVDAIDAAHPGTAARLAAALTAAVFYVDHERQVWLTPPRAERRVIHYQAVAAPGAGPAVDGLVALFALADAVEQAAGRLTLFDGGRRLAFGPAPVSALMHFA